MDIQKLDALQQKSLQLKAVMVAQQLLDGAEIYLADELEAGLKLLSLELLDQIRTLAHGGRDG